MIYDWELKGILESNIAWCNKHDMQYEIRNNKVFVNSSEFYTVHMKNSNN